MPSLVSNEGVYRGRASATAVNTTSTGLPQFVIGFAALEWYNPDTQEWMAWGEYDEAVTAYLCLFGKKDQPLRSATDVMKVFGWDGVSFAGLDELDCSAIDFQIRVADEEYEGVVRRKVQGIAAYDANPNGTAGTVEKMDGKERNALDSKFGSALKKLSGGKVKVAKAPTTSPTAPSKTTTVAEEVAATAVDTPKATPPKRPSATPKTKTKKGSITIEYTYDSAWQAVVDATPEADEDERATAWVASLDVVAPDQTEDKIKSADWADVVKLTVSELATH